MMRCDFVLHIMHACIGVWSRFQFISAVRHRSVNKAVTNEYSGRVATLHKRRSRRTRQSAALEDDSLAVRAQNQTGTFREVQSAVFDARVGIVDRKLLHAC